VFWFPRFLLYSTFEIVKGSNGQSVEDFGREILKEYPDYSALLILEQYYSLSLGVLTYCISGLNFKPIF